MILSGIVYFLQSLGALQRRQHSEDDRSTFSLANFNWQSRHVNTSEDICKNSVQGRDILVDDKGIYWLVTYSP
jgi:hypothetical protein